VTWRKPLPAMRELQIIKLRLAASRELRRQIRPEYPLLLPEDCDCLIEMIDAVLMDQDPREKYWQTMKGATLKNLPKKTVAMMLFALRLQGTTGGEEHTPKETQDLIARCAEETGLTFDALMHAYRKLRWPGTKKREKSTRVRRS
jgi:hypothetical protein